MEVKVGSLSCQTKVSWTCSLACNGSKMKILEFANSVDPDEVAHSEPPHMDLHCLPYSL